VEVAEIEVAIIGDLGRGSLQVRPVDLLEHVGDPIRDFAFDQSIGIQDLFPLSQGIFIPHA
jgi:hypothetical protein